MQEFLSESDEVCISCIIVVAMRLFILGVEILRFELSFLYQTVRTCDFLNWHSAQQSIFYLLYYIIRYVLS